MLHPHVLLNICPIQLTPFGRYLQRSFCLNTPHKQPPQELAPLQVTPASRRGEDNHTHLCTHSPSRQARSRHWAWLQALAYQQKPLRGQGNENALYVHETTALVDGLRVGIWSDCWQHPTIGPLWPCTGPLAAQGPNQCTHNRQSSLLELRAHVGHSQQKGTNTHIGDSSEASGPGEQGILCYRAPQELFFLRPL